MTNNENDLALVFLENAFEHRFGLRRIVDVDGQIEWISDALSGTVTLEIATKCIASGVKPDSVPFNTARQIVATQSQAEAWNYTVWTGATKLIVTGCAAAQTVFIQACKRAQTLTGGPNNTVRLLRFVLAYRTQ